MKTEFSPNIPIYVQVMEYIKKEIVTGRLAPGEKIPAVRELAGELQVNPNTIQRTFQELEREGVAETRRGTGRFVTMNEEKIKELRKEMAKELLDNFIDGMNNLGFMEEEILSILHSSLEKKKEGNEWRNY
ncbi:GntR family transcriptional regulator [Bacillus albus]|uniref:GntR family transcriptional regulator n=1 Tax=Bacillus wiedmannii TaxID=1890302 RepID=A0A2A7VQX9_9BACI|nr:MULTISPECIES: GntR family transcriptional regulator [Bacillus cereus group]MBU5220621.1 GntR family transcriptional regulator [Bacillus albus]PEJ00666.1 GntR family transcriptional regulator [Bacillus wiedmannii]PFB73431.1 GntR family transcriptional regulator [Bacillus anthracis]PHC67265.1 GntR family transcriptional regulator [Bacillus wiedmannii]